MRGVSRLGVPGLSGIDSLAAAEFAKDSIGSITVGVIAGSELVWTHSYGFADMKSRRVANRNTVYRIGSITKPFTAVMLMQLDRGQDSPVRSSREISPRDQAGRRDVARRAAGHLPPTCDDDRRPRARAARGRSILDGARRELGANVDLRASAHELRIISRNAVLLLEHRLRDTRRRAGRVSRASRTSIGNARASSIRSA